MSFSKKEQIASKIESEDTKRQNALSASFRNIIEKWLSR